MGPEKQNIIPSNGISSGSVHEAAVNAHKLAHNTGVPSPDEVTSLNKLLQWGAAHTSSPVDTRPINPRNAPTDMEWLSAAFPDMNAEVKRLITLLEAALSDSISSNTSVDDMVEMLESLEEYLSDINYAHNLESLRVLPPLLLAVGHISPSVRAAGAWCLGSALQDAPQNGDLLAAADGLSLLAGTLCDCSAAVRAKGVRAVSAFLRACSDALRARFRELDAGSMLRDAICDDDMRVRSRAMFFVAHAAECGNTWFVKEVIADTRAVASIVRNVSDVDLADVAAVEACTDAVSALLRCDAAGTLKTMPEIDAIVKEARARCEDTDVCAVLDRVVKLLP